MRSFWPSREVRQRLRMISTCQCSMPRSVWRSSWPNAMANTPSNTCDDQYRRLREEFSEDQLLELGAHIAWENYRARYNRVFDVESDELYHPNSAAK